MGPLLIETLRGAPPPTAGTPARRPPAESPVAAALRVARSVRRRPPREPIPTPVLGEEEATTLLYGRRSGTVVASPVRPPVR